MAPRNLTKSELEHYGYDVPGTAKRVEPEEATEAPQVTFDWGSGGQLGSSHSRLARKVYMQALGWLGGLAVIGAFAFGITSIGIWGDVDDYAGLEKKEVRDVSAKLLSMTGHDDWQLVDATHSSIFGHKAWNAKYRRPDATNRCIFVWQDGRTHHRMSRLTKCT